MTKQKYSVGRKLIFQGIKPTEVLLALNEPNGNGFYITLITRKVDITRSHLNKIINLFKRNGWVRLYTPSDNFRIKRVSLTKKGKELARRLFEVYHLLDGDIEE